MKLKKKRRDDDRPKATVAGLTSIRIYLITVLTGSFKDTIVHWQLIVVEPVGRPDRSVWWAADVVVLDADTVVLSDDDHVRVLSPGRECVDIRLAASVVVL